MATGEAAEVCEGWRLKASSPDERIAHTIMDLIGQTIGQYHIIEPIGHGGMAWVFKAYQPTLERYVAIKVLTPQQADTPEFRERFIREAKAIAQLNHPNILPIIDYGQSAELSYIVMKYVAGGTLADRLKHAIDLATTSRLITQIAAALDHAHKRGVLHRDVKPSNVLLDEGEWVQLADFGLAKIRADDLALTGSGMSMGTPSYLSPEQGQGAPLDHHADIYSLGVILYEMVTGRLPFNAETPMGVMIKHIYDAPPSPRTLNPNMPEALEAIVLKGLAKSIDERYHSASELAQAVRLALAAASASEVVSAPVISTDATPRLGLRAVSPAPLAVSDKILFEETAPAVRYFVGRQSELVAYRARLARNRFVIITGMAGMGKSTLGAKLAREVAENPDNIFWFTFDQVEKSTADALYWALAAFLETRGEPSLARYLRGEIGAQKPLERMAKLNLLIASLASGHHVLCFDDFQIVKDVPEIAYIFQIIRQRFIDLQQSLPAHFIVMGREVPVDMEYLAPEALSGLSMEETTLFLNERGVTLTPEQNQKLWEHTEGNPKLLELSAGALAGLPAGAVDSLIATLVRKGDIRDYLMTNIYAALTPEDQAVLGALAVFPGAVEREVVEEMLDDEGITHVAQRVDALLNKHILNETEDERAVVRIDCHDLVRDYCYHVLSRRERDQFHERAAQYFEQDDNWLAAAYHHFERRALATALDLLTSHADAIINVGSAAALAELLSRFNAVPLTPAQRVVLQKAHGDCFRIRGEYQSAIAAYGGALEEATSDAGRAELLRLISRAYLKRGDYAQALDYATRSLQIGEQSEDNLGDVAESHHDLGWAYYRLGQLDQALDHFNTSQQLAQQLGKRVLMAEVGLGHGLIAWKQGRLDDARNEFETSRRIFHEYHDRTNEAYAIGNLGLVYGEMDDAGRQIACYQQAADIQEQIGDLDGLLLAFNNLGYLFFTQENYPQAVYYYERMLHLARSIGHRPMSSIAYSGLADAYLKQQEIRQALDCALRAQQLAQEAGSGEELGVACRILGEVWLDLDDAAQAKSLFEQSIPLLEQYREEYELAKARRGYSQAVLRLNTDSTTRSIGE